MRRKLLLFYHAWPDTPPLSLRNIIASLGLLVVGMTLLVLSYGTGQGVQQIAGHNVVMEVTGNAWGESACLVFASVVSYASASPTHS